MDADEHEGLTPASAFSLLGHDHRVDILLSLLELLRSGAEYPASFSSLKDTSDIAVSAQFNYHLQQLTGSLLSRNQEGYSFSAAGWELATGILAGTYTTSVAIEAAAIEGTCPLCRREALVIRYERGWLAVECGSCSSELTRKMFPPGGLENRSPDEISRTLDRLVRARINLVRAGLCPWCKGIIHPVVGSADPWKTAGRDAAYWCERCGNRFYPPVGQFLVESPLVREFYREQGTDWAALPFWEHRFCIDDDLPSVTEHERWRCEIRIELAETLVVELDADLEIAATAIE